MTSHGTNRGPVHDGRRGDASDGRVDRTAATPLDDDLGRTCSDGSQSPRKSAHGLGIGADTNRSNGARANPPAFPMLVARRLSSGGGSRFFDRLEMATRVTRPKVIRALRGEGQRVRHGPTGDVGTVYADPRLEVVWVRKQRELVDPRWFSSPEVDILTVLQGRLRVEFADAREPPRILDAGDLLVLPPHTKCRAYRWPRNTRRATVFVAVYPIRRPRRGTR